MSKKLERPPQLLAPLSRAALTDLLEDKGPPTCDRLPPVILLQKCPCGREWLTEGAQARQQCGSCERWMLSTTSSGARA